MYPGFKLSQDEKDELQAKRTLGLKKLGSLGLLLAGCSFIAMVIGAASIGVQASDPSPPYMLGTALIAGVLMVTGGILAILGARKGLTETGEDVSSCVKCYVIGFFVVNVIGITVCILVALGGGIAGIVLCVLEGKIKKLENICQPHHNANLSLSVLTLLVAFVLFILAIMGSCFLCFYGPAFGFKNRQQQRMERRMRRMQTDNARQQHFATAYSSGQV